MGKLIFDADKKICRNCRIKNGYLARDDGFHTAIRSVCDCCGGIESILPARHWVLPFEIELKEFYQNRSKYPRIKPDLELKQWSRYDYRKGKTYHQSLQDAASVKKS
jgi:hypothetical protein